MASKLGWSGSVMLQKLPPKKEFCIDLLSATGMAIETLDAHYRRDWLDGARVATAQAEWQNVNQFLTWEDGKKLMQEEVENRGTGKIGALTWGETSFTSLAIMLGNVNPEAGENFLDLGAGLGKVLCAAHLLCDFKECVGIELSPGMAEAGQTLVQQFSEQRRVHGGTVELRQGDFLQVILAYAHHKILSA